MPLLNIGDNTLSKIISVTHRTIIPLIKLKLNNYNITLRSETYSKVMPTKHYSRRKRQQQSQRIAIVGLIIATILLILVLIKLIFFGKTTLASDRRLDLSEANSYETFETATVSTSDAIMYTDNGSSSNISEHTAITISAYYYDVTFKNKDITLAQFTINGDTYYIDTNDISLEQDNTINVYIAETLGYSHADITDDIKSSFEQAAYKTDDGKPLGIIIHDTGVDNSTIDSEVNYMMQNYDEEGVFVHSFIDSDTILRIADEGYKAQGAGANANPYYIQFELIHENSQKGFAKQLANAAYYVAYMLKKYNLPVTLGQEDGEGTIWTHEMVSLYFGGTDHIDPTDYWIETANDYFGTDYDVDDFVKLIQAYYNAF